MAPRPYSPEHDKGERRPHPLRLGRLLLSIAAAGLWGCAPGVEAPADRGVCWHMVQPKPGKYAFFPVARNQPDLEHCAAALEAMRVHFLSLGGSREEVDGAFQGQFLFIDSRGVFTAGGLNSTPFLALVRTGDGHLAPQGSATPQ